MGQYLNGLDLLNVTGFGKTTAWIKQLPLKQIAVLIIRSDHHWLPILIQFPSNGFKQVYHLNCVDDTRLQKACLKGTKSESSLARGAPSYINRAASFMAVTQALNWGSCTGIAWPLAGHLSVVQREPIPEVTKRRADRLAVTLISVELCLRLRFRCAFHSARTNHLSCCVCWTCEKITAMQGLRLNIIKSLSVVVVVLYASGILSRKKMIQARNGKKSAPSFLPLN
jgi:hypothetical protein